MGHSGRSRPGVGSFSRSPGPGPRGFHHKSYPINRLQPWTTTPGRVGAGSRAGALRGPLHGVWDRNPMGAAVFRGRSSEN